MFAKILLALALLVVLIVATAVLIGYAVSAPRYRGPVTDHFDGKQFRNPGNVVAKGVGDVLRWQLNREQTQPWGPYRNEPPGPPPPARVTGDSVRVTFVNHSTVLLQFDSLNVVTDPVWYNRTSPYQFVGPKRNRPPGLRFDDLPKIDMILLSHNHWDHVDIGTIKRLCARDEPRIYCPLGVKAFLEQQGCRNVVEMDWRQATTFRPGTTVHCVPAQHFSGRGLFDRDATLWAGFLIDNNVVGKLYFVGDTGYGPFFRQIGEQFGPLRLALIPIGAYKPDWFMAPVHCSPAEAVQIHQDVRARQSVAIHYGTFPLADDGETEPVTDLTTALQRANLPSAQFRALPEGVGVVF